MADHSHLKDQRDRFLAFAFASADLFLEIDDGGKVAFALGATKTLIGIEEQDVIGFAWANIFGPGFRDQLEALRLSAKPGQRCGPLQVRLDSTLGGSRKTIVTAIRMPGASHFHVTLAFPHESAANAQSETEFQPIELKDKNNFLSSASASIGLARSLGENVDVTLLDLAGAKEARLKMGEESWTRFSNSLTALLSASSVGGQSAAEIAEGRYTVIHDRTTHSDVIVNQLENLLTQSEMQDCGIQVQSKTVSADLNSLSDREAAKALVYTINEFERRGTELNIESLNSSFKAYVTVNANKIQQFKNMIEQLNFEIHFQPIVELESEECSHFEMLARFKGNVSTYEWIVFGEDIGMAADFDIAVVERALNYVRYKAQGRRSRFAINLSGQSIQSEAFFKKLMDLLALHKNPSDRIMFEITESTLIHDLDMVGKFIGILQAEKYKICMDDFGAGAASFQYLQKFPVDYVKIDGQYTRKILKSERDRVLVKNMARMCTDLGIQMVAEQIEEKAEAEMLLEMGVPLGQGYYYAKPGSRPEYAPAKKPAGTITSR